MTKGTCGCCSGYAANTPRAVFNRPGLPSVTYRAGRHEDFLRSMIAHLTNASRPALAGLTTRDDDDFTIALLDSWAMVADVLTFYNERLVNESFVRTARERVSLQELGKLIGYQLDPGVAAETHLAFSTEPPPTVPTAQSKDPGSSAPTTPPVVSLDAGLRVQSIPGQGEKPQTFETVEAIEARPEWNAMPVTATVAWSALAGNVTEAWFEGVGLNIGPGDVLLLAGSDITGERWDVRILEVVEPDPSAGHTRVSWNKALGSDVPKKQPAADPAAFVLRKRINVFGYNAASWKAMSQDFKDEYTGTTTPTTEWPNFTIAEVSGNFVDLDGSHPDIVVGSFVVLNTPDYRELWIVKDVAELARSEFATSGKVTRIELSGGENYQRFAGNVRETTVFAVTEPLTLADQPDQSDVGSTEVAVHTDVSDMAPGRTLIVAGTTVAGDETSELAVVKSVAANGTTWTLEFDGGLANVYDRSTVVIHGNVALATHGETVTEILGSGRASEEFQRFSLARESLTYVQSTDPSGKTSSLEVRVNAVAWQETPTLYGAGVSDQTYSVRVDERGRVGVRFGDGIRASRLPTGSQNVVAEYRYGRGIAGNVGAGSLSQLLDRPLGIKGVTNPTSADGGVDPEDKEAARSTMPLRVRTLDRAVSLLDYADFALAFTGVSKAHATVLPIHGTRTIVVTVAFTPGTVTDPTARVAVIESSLRTYGDPQVEVKVLSHSESAFRLAMNVVVDSSYDTSDVTKAVRDKIAASFGFGSRKLTEPLHRSEIISAAHDVKGITSVDIDDLYTGSVPHLADRLFPELPSITASGNVAPAGLIVIDSDPFDSLEATT